FYIVARTSPSAVPFRPQRAGTPVLHCGADVPVRGPLSPPTNGRGRPFYVVARTSPSAVPFLPPTGEDACFTVWRGRPRPRALFASNGRGRPSWRATLRRSS